MKNEQIATAFQYGEEATNPNGSFYVEVIDGVVMAFSYGQHFPIAVKFIDGVLFNSDGYSNTTARHKNLILSTINRELTDDEKLPTGDLKRIIDAVKYDGIRRKAELVLNKI